MNEATAFLWTIAALIALLELARLLFGLMYAA
jgi:hypothetical protein